MDVNTNFIQKLSDGDSHTISLLYRSTYPKVKKFIMTNRGTKEDAEDIFQKAILQVALRYKKEKNEVSGSVEGYIFTICKNLWRREIAYKKTTSIEDNYIQIRDDANDFSNALLEQKKWELFYNTLQKIEGNCKKILDLYFAKETYSEIKKTFDYTSESVARQRVFKCKKKLESLIKKDDRFKKLF